MKKVFKLILVILWMGIIFSFSAQKAEDSSKLSDGIIIKVAKVFVDKDLSTEKQEELLDKYTKVVRKTAHFTIYLILGVLVTNLLFEYNTNKKRILFSILICIIYSITDEVHQLFVPGRSGEITDVFIDSSGSIIGVLAYYYMIKSRFINKFYKIKN